VVHGGISETTVAPSAWWGHQPAPNPPCQSQPAIPPNAAEGISPRWTHRPHSGLRRRGKRQLDRLTHKVLDLRDPREYEAERLTHPARTSLNVPFRPDPGAFVAAARMAVPPSAPILILSADGGPEGLAAAQWLAEAGYREVFVVDGGYRAWRERYTPSGRNVPPKGRWISTGKEALKSGLNVGLAAASYEERLNVEDLTTKDLDPPSRFP